MKYFDTIGDETLALDAFDLGNAKARVLIGIDTNSDYISTYMSPCEARVFAQEILFLLDGKLDLEAG